MKYRFKDALNPKLLNNALADCYLINLQLLLSRTIQSHLTISFPLFVFATFGFLFSVFFVHFK